MSTTSIIRTMITQKLPKQIVEQFHLLFLEQLARKLSKDYYAVKGGCNLRFFFQSIRYSEDLDIDVKTIAKGTLQKKVYAILTSQALKNILTVRGIEIANISEPKQTQTTQRWKLALKASNHTLPIQTKIEFSRRGMKGDIQFGLIDAQLIQQYKLMPIMLNHYELSGAFQQKISALINRTQTQCRDVFDLFLLISKGANSSMLTKDQINTIETAISNAIGLTFDEYKSQVVAYLPPEHHAIYDDKSTWDNIQNTVISVIETKS